VTSENINPTTFFAPPNRASSQLLQLQVSMTGDNPVINGLMQTVGGLLAVLNEQRQVLCLNACLLRELGIENSSDVLGLRLGEIFRCTHAADPPNGCGTTRYCASCGAAIAMAVCLENHEPAARKCIISVKNDHQDKEIVLQIHAAPIEIGRHSCLVLFMRDITASERSAILERIFLHDLNNLVTGLDGVSEALAAQLQDEQEELGRLITRLTRRLTQELDIQRAIYQDQTTGFCLHPEPVKVPEVLDELRSSLSRHPATFGKSLDIGQIDSGMRLQSDPSLLLRVLLNMTINAFEATDTGGMVRLWVESSPENFSFHIWNRTPIPRHIVPRIFQLYFSTKPGKGRGIGTYMMKLITEDYLGGAISFDSSATRGTTFRLQMPRTDLEETRH